MKYIFSYFNDTKILHWNDEIKAETNGEKQIIGSSISPILFPFDLISKTLQHGLPRKILFRYLNDSPNLLKTFSRVLSEAFTILLSRLLKIKIIWILHNIDKETSENYPKLTAFRRRMLLKSSEKVFVTHHLFISEASKKLGIDSADIGVSCFGPEKFADEISQDIDLNILTTWNQNYKVGLWVGDFNKKKIKGLDIIGKILKDDINDRFRFLIIGINKQVVFNYLEINFGLSLEYLKVKTYIIGSYACFPTKYWKNRIDFVVKTLSDQSLPLTLSYAANVKIPMVVTSQCIISKIVLTEKIGIELTDSNTSDNLLISLDKNNYNFDQYISRNNWLVGIKNLFNLL